MANDSSARAGILERLADLLASHLDEGAYADEEYLAGVRSLANQLESGFTDERSIPLHVRQVLGDAYQVRLDGDYCNNIERAIAHHRAVSSGLAGTHTDRWADSQLSLGEALILRVQGLERDNLTLAIKCLQNSLETIENGSTRRIGRARALYALGVAHMRLFDLNYNPNETLPQALRQFHSCLLAGGAHSAINAKVAAGRLQCLLRIEAGRPEEDIVRSVAEVRELLDGIPERVNLRADLQCTLGDTLLMFQGDLDGAIGYYSTALPAYTESYRRERRKLRRLLGDLYAFAGQWRFSADNYRHAIDVNDAIYHSTMLRSSREIELRESFLLHERAAIAITNTGELADAVVTLESNRARWLSGALGRDLAVGGTRVADHSALIAYENAASVVRELEAHESAVAAMMRKSHAHDDHQESLQWATEEFTRRILEGDYSDEFREMTIQSLEDLKAIGGPIRSMQESLRRELIDAHEKLSVARDRLDLTGSPPSSSSTITFADVAAEVKAGQPIAYVLTSELGATTLLIWRMPSGSGEDGGSVVVESVESVGAASDEDGVLDQLRSILVSEENGEITGGYIEGQQGNKAALNASLPDLLLTLGRRLVGPLLARLKEIEAGGVVLIGVGPVGLTPLHTALCEVDSHWTSLIDNFDVAFAPSTITMKLARAASLRARTNSSLVAVGDPDTDLHSLPYSRAEVKGIARLFDRAVVLVGSDATKSAFLTTSGDASHVHLSCHGSHDATTCLHSSLVLSTDGSRPKFDPGNVATYLPSSRVGYSRRDDPLYVVELLERRQFDGVSLVVLSACQSAVSDGRNLLDEIVSFPAAFIFAGAPAVIGTLWSVPDLPTAVLMMRLYEYMITDGLRPIRALRHAQLWLRDLTLGELRHFLLANLEFRKAVMSDAGSDVDRIMASSDHTLKLFAHPFYWAPFAYFGAE